MWIAWQGNLRRRLGVPEGCEGTAKKIEGPSLTPRLVEKGVRLSIRKREAGKDPAFKPAPRAAISWAFVLPNVNHVTLDGRVRRYSGWGAIVSIEGRTMKIRRKAYRRKAYRWFRFVVSGRFLEKFLNLRYDAFVARALDNEQARSTGRRS